MVSATPVLQRALRRLALTTKQVGKGFYKGTGSGSMGRHTKYGGYQIDWKKVRTFKVPDLTDFQLSPFVTKKVEKTPGRFPGSGPLDGAAYLQAWRDMGGLH